MLELRLAGIHDDGENLVLESADGSSYLLPIDQNLRQSIAKARRISPLRTGNSGTFGPRDIQTRFRQGATVEEISAESGWEPERVRRYEWPIVAERANIIHTARRTVISATPGGSAPAQTLNQLIELAAEQYGFIDSPMDWSTWQQESGQWSVALDVAVGDAVARALPRGVMFPARWTFNPANQSIYASNEAAYFLMGRDNSKDSPIPAAPAAEVEEAPQLTAVRVPENKEQNELLDELNSRRGARSFDPASERKLADLLERARRGSRPVGEDLDQAHHPGEVTEAVLAESESAETVEAPSPSPAEGDSAVVSAVADVAPVDVDAAQDSINEANAQEPAVASLAESEQAESATVQAETSGVAVEAVADSAEEAEAADEAETTGDEADEQETRSRSQRGKRTSVPSWDDIIFGNQRR